MHLLFALMRFYPFWALPLALVLGEIAWHFHRRRKGIQYSFWAGALFFFCTTLAWFILRGDLHSDAWVKALMGS